MVAALISAVWHIPSTGQSFLSGRFAFVGGLGSSIFKFVFLYRNTAYVMSRVIQYTPVFFIFIISSSAGWIHFHEGCMACTMSVQHA